MKKKQKKTFADMIQNLISLQLKAQWLYSGEANWKERDLVDTEIIRLKYQINKLLIIRE